MYMTYMYNVNICRMHWFVIFLCLNHLPFAAISHHYSQESAQQTTTTIDYDCFSLIPHTDISISPSRGSTCATRLCLLVFFNLHWQPTLSLINLAMFIDFQVMKKNLGAAMQEDAADGSRAGLRRLEAAVASHYESLLEDSATSVKDKLSEVCGAATSWLSTEGVNPLKSTSPLAVTTHSAFGKLKAMVLASCTCCASVDCNQCVFHASEIQLSDVMFEITRNIHHVFDDKFMSFANLFLAQTVSGWMMFLKENLTK